MTSNAESVYQFAIGDRVIDSDDESPSAGRVVSVPDETAEEFQIDAIEKTVAQCNPEYPASDPVVGIAFGDDGNGPTYHYPASRLQSVSENWEPEPSKTPAQREREETIEQNRDAFEAVDAAVRYLAQSPKQSAEWFDQHYDPAIRPDTRGDCVHSREDRYHPNDPSAIVCWRCNDGGRRPRKLRDDDPVPSDAPCQSQTSRDPSSTLKQWFGEEVVAGNEDRRLTEEVEKSIKPNAEFAYLNRYAQQLRDEDDSRRRGAILRIAYETTVGGALDEDYNHSRTCAFLRDIGLDTDKLLPGGDPYVPGTGK